MFVHITEMNLKKLQLQLKFLFKILAASSALRYRLPGARILECHPAPPTNAVTSLKPYVRRMPEKTQGVYPQN